MNGVILLNDQHAHHVLGCAGVPHVTTPAADGLRFEQAVWAVIPCMLSRHAIVTELITGSTPIDW